MQILVGNTNNWQNIPGYIEIFIDVPMEELRRRDPKKIYERAFVGKIKNVYGVNLKVNYPKESDAHLIWSPEKNVESMINELLGKVF